MKQKILFTLSTLIALSMIYCFSFQKVEKQKPDPVIAAFYVPMIEQDTVKKQDTIKKDSIVPVAIAVTVVDSIAVEGNFTYKLLNKKGHASYYADKFTGRKTASGRIFDNNKLTAAHKKLPFGTKVRVTNERNGKSVIVEITDRGPYVKGREIDLSRRAFMAVAGSTWGGSIVVKLEIVKKIRK
jgi:rare lipoprotein A